MSALRVETLRLFWLEVFLAVCEEKNLSGAARVLGVNQSNITRSLEELQVWLGKTLVETARVFGKEKNLIVSAKITEAGEEFKLIAQKALEDLNGFRKKGYDKDFLINMTKKLIEEMDSDIKSGKIITDADILSLHLQGFTHRISRFSPKTSILSIMKLVKQVRSSYVRYEKLKRYDTRRQKLLPKRPLPENYAE